MSHEHSPHTQTPCRKATHLTVASTAPTKRTRAGSAINTSSPASEPVRIGSIQQPRSRNCLRLLQLRHLTLDGDGIHSITDAGVVNLASLQQLRHLNLYCGAQITDAGLVSVASLQQLQHLDLDGCCNITDVGLAILASLQQLWHLDLSDCYNITNAGLVSVASLQNLEYLILCRCQNIDDAGLASVALLRQLWHLNLTSVATLLMLGSRALRCCMS